MPSHESIQYGIDRYLGYKPGSDRIAFVTNDAATTSLLTLSRVALLKSGFKLVKLFSPEHGISAQGADGEFQFDSKDEITGLPVISLYGERLAPTEEDLQDVDMVIFDIPDVGCRFYTYQWTLSYIMQTCSKLNKRLLVLDRPNPLSGNLELIEGPMLEASCASFIGRWNIALRHSCTIGELSLLWKQQYCPGLNIDIVPVKGWSRNLFFDDLSLPFVPTSPGIPDFSNALLYPGMGLLEGINVSEGRGTTLPFRVCGAPWVKSGRLSDAFNDFEVPGVISKPYSFQPVSGRYAGEYCNGIMLHVTNKHLFHPVFSGWMLMKLMMDHYPDKIQLHLYKTRANPSGENHLDKLLGIRNSFACLQDDGLFTESIEKINVVENWRRTIASFLLYK